MADAKGAGRTVPYRVIGTGGKRIPITDPADSPCTGHTMSQTTNTSNPKSAAAERRRHYRAAVAPTSALKVRVWRIDPGVPLSRRPMPSQELAVGVIKMSAGGMTVELPATDDDDRPIAMRETDRLRVEVTYADKVALIEGRLRALPIPPGAARRTGLAFHGREGDHDFREARATISTIVACVQREELRERGSNRAPRAV